MVLALAALAAAVWAITAIVGGATPWLYLGIVGISLVAFLYLVLLSMGILYRVDRLNRDVERRVKLFE